MRNDGTSGPKTPELQVVEGPEPDDLVQQAADDAVVAVLSRLGSFRGESRFTTWAWTPPSWPRCAPASQR